MNLELTRSFIKYFSLTLKIYFNPCFKKYIVEQMRYMTFQRDNFSFLTQSLLLLLAFIRMRNPFWLLHDCFRSSRNLSPISKCSNRRTVK